MIDARGSVFGVGASRHGQGCPESALLTQVASREGLSLDADLDTLATALYVTADDLLKAHPERVPARPATGFQTRISDAELVTLAVMQSLLQMPKERRFLRYARKHL